MDVWVDGEVVESKGEFVDDGTETIFQVGGKEACIHTVQSGSAIKQVRVLNRTPARPALPCFVPPCSSSLSAVSSCYRRCL